MKANLVPNDIFDRFDTGTIKPGDFEYNSDSQGVDAGMLICCPQCERILSLQFRGDGPKWTWDGNHDAPTLTPSINHVGCWHGFLRAGEFVSC